MNNSQACDNVSSNDNNNNSYLTKLVEKFCSGFDVNFIDKMLYYIESFDNLIAFKDQIDFCLREKIQLDDMTFEKVGLNDLKCLIQAKHMCNHVKFRPKTEVEEKSLLEIIKTFE